MLGGSAEACGASRAYSPASPALADGKTLDIFEVTDLQAMQG